MKIDAEGSPAYSGVNTVLECRLAPESRSECAPRTDPAPVEWRKAVMNGRSIPESHYNLLQSRPRIATVSKLPLLDHSALRCETFSCF
jgi:hypothetical protein